MRCYSSPLSLHTTIAGKSRPLLISSPCAALIQRHRLLDIHSVYYYRTVATVLAFAFSHPSCSRRPNLLGNTCWRYCLPTRWGITFLSSLTGGYYSAFFHSSAAAVFWRVHLARSSRSNPQYLPGGPLRHRIAGPLQFHRLPAIAVVGILLTQPPLFNGTE